ncbi:MAG TPA: RimK family alpha-L-glutamate ligase [Candidatus Polarisedimenticolia bacterium]|nr:RimK family alpha-L-glutamate ligase [Candidatus Polarisedimenticolia bacterium]
MRQVGILAAAEGWHLRELRRAFAALGAETVRFDPTRLVGRTHAGAAAPGAPAAAAEPWDGLDALLVRVIPPGSLDQIVFRVDLLHHLADRGLPVVNPPRALERTIDKHWTSRLLEDAGIPTPRTIATERADEALAAFRSLRDAVVKPLLGSGGRGIFRVSDEDHAWRAFRALEQQRFVLYLQEFVPHGRHDLRLFVAGGEVIAAARREGDGWKTNLAAGARALPHRPTAAQESLAVGAAAAVGADYAGVDLLEAEDGRLLVVEVNGIPAWEGIGRATGIDIAAVIASRVRARVAAGARMSGGA